jgi:hypothetical protein
MNKQEFENYIQSFCLNHNIDFKVFEGTSAYTVMNNSECAGFFESNPKIKPTLGIAKGLPEQTFYEVLAHEFSHANQYLEDSPFWINSRLTKEEVLKYSTLELDLTGFETGDLFSLWLDKKIELPKEVLQDMVRRTTEVEFDCERRTVELAKTLGLNIDPNTYAQKANAYLITYFYALKNRRWTTSGHATYSKPEVYTQLPQIIDPVFCEKLAENIEALITLHCIKD